MYNNWHNTVYTGEYVEFVPMASPGHKLRSAVDVTGINRGPMMADFASWRIVYYRQDDNNGGGGGETDLDDDDETATTVEGPLESTAGGIVEGIPNLGLENKNLEDFIQKLDFIDHDADIEIPTFHNPE
jgi:hypothetical protein